MHRAPPRERPTPAQIAALPPYDQLPATRIHVLQTPEQLAFAARELRAAVHVGFDTESKPIFKAGTPQTGPARAAVRDAPRRVHRAAGPPRHGRLPARDDRVRRHRQGGLRPGLRQAADKASLGLRLGRSIDLSFLVRRLGFDQPVGLKVAVAVVLGSPLRQVEGGHHPRTGQTRELTEQQLRYAANDAHASLDIFRALSDGAELAARLRDDAESRRRL